MENILEKLKKQDKKEDDKNTTTHKILSSC